MKFRRRLDPIGELLSRSIEADVLCNGVHLATDPFDFLEAEVMDFARRERSGRLRGNLSRVELRPARPGGGAGLLTARRHVLRYVELAQRAKRREDLVGQRGAAHRGQPFSIGRRKTSREALKRRIQRTCGDVRRKERVDLRRDALHDDAWREPPARHGPPQPAGKLLELGRDGAESLEVILVVEHRVEARYPNQRWEAGKSDLRPVELVDTQPQISTGGVGFAEDREPAKVEIDDRREHVEGDPVLIYQGVAVDALQLLRKVRNERVAASDGRFGEIG